MTNLVDIVKDNKNVFMVLGGAVVLIAVVFVLQTKLGGGKTPPKVDGGTVVIKDCLGTPEVHKAPANSFVTFDNQDSSAHKLTIWNETFDLKASGKTEIQANKTPDTTYPYQCDGKTGGAVYINKAS